MLGRVIVAAILVAAVAATPASATFRGHNGLIALDNHRSVVTVNAHDGTEVGLVADGMHPAWSPDGRRIAFIRAADDSGIYVANADGTNEGRIPVPAFGDCEPAWSANGRRLVFMTGEPGAFALMTINSDGTDLRVLVKPLGGEDYEPAWSPNGKWIAFHVFQQSRAGSSDHIWLVHPNGSQLHRLTRSRANESSPDWSPDSTRLVYSRNGDLVVRSLRTGRTRLVLRGKPFDGSPAWSPDGRMIAFIRWSADRETDALDLIAANGHNARTLVQGGTFDGLDWQALR